jgi:CopG family nickel-responsive transcriptional regulator
MAKTESTVRFTVSLPGALLKDLDRRMIARGYASRSELVRDLIREQLVQEKWESDGGEVVGILTIAYDHHHRGLLNVLASTHIHMGREDCLEAIFIRGNPREVEKLSIEISGLRGVKFARLTRAGKVAM